VTTVDPERAIARSALPWFFPALAVAAAAGALLGGRDAAISAAIGIVIVAANLISHALSLAWAAKISLPVIYAVGLGGFAVRLGIIFGVMIALNQLDWFSPLAFAAAVVPCTIVLLMFEMKQLTGQTQTDLWDFGATRGSR
jgi:hypothetical protein